MWNRLLLAIDQFGTGEAALDFTTGLACRWRAEVTVFHVRELPRVLRIPSLESVDEARSLVASAVLHLRSAGLDAEGRLCSARGESVANHIVDEASRWKCDAIVLGSRRLRGFSRLSAWGVRERVLRLSPLPVIVAPTPLGKPGSWRSGPGLSDLESVRLRRR
jgi:nucleotide-binding universal stress UspA family protein